MWIHPVYFFWCVFYDSKWNCIENYLKMFVFFWNVCVFLKLEVNVLDAYCLFNEKESRGTKYTATDWNWIWVATRRANLMCHPKIFTCPIWPPYENVLGRHWPSGCWAVYPFGTTALLSQLVFILKDISNVTNTVFLRCSSFLILCWCISIQLWMSTSND